MQASNSGFTIVEVLLSTTILSVSVIVVGLGVQTGSVIVRETRDLEIVQAQAQRYMDIVVAQSFGDVTDDNPKLEQVDEILDDDADVGDITLMQLTRVPGAADGLKFTLENFPVEGEWRLAVDRDLNGDGEVAGELETGNKVLRIRVLFNDELVLETHKASEVTN